MFKASATEILRLYPILRHVLTVVVSPSALAADECKSFLALCRVVDCMQIAKWGVADAILRDMDAAIDHIHRFGSDHTDTIVTENAETAAEFTQRVQSSCTLVNASTRFNDGFQLGMGAEIGISTSRVHAYGPMGLEELTSQRFVVEGAGHVR